MSKSASKSNRYVITDPDTREAMGWPLLEEKKTCPLFEEIAKIKTELAALKAVLREAGNE